MRGMETREDLLAQGLSDKERKKRVKKENKDVKKNTKAERKRLENSSEVPSEKSESSSRRSASTRLTDLREDGRRALIKVKRPSPLRRLLA